MAPGIQHYEAARDVLHFHCPVCGEQHEYDLSAVQLVKNHPEERALWGMCIGSCPGCAARGVETTHHLNLNLPDDHPHAEHINALLRAKHGAELPPPSLPGLAADDPPSVLGNGQ